MQTSDPSYGSERGIPEREVVHCTHSAGRYTRLKDINGIKITNSRRTVYGEQREIVKHIEKNREKESEYRTGKERVVENF